MRFFVTITLLLSFTCYGYSNTCAITVTINTINSTCQDPNGKVIAQASGGTAPYYYELTATFFSMYNYTGIFYKVPAGTYNLKVTDANGQTDNQPVTINNTFLKPTGTTSNRIKPSGCLTQDAQFQINATGGVPPYWYSIDNISYQTSNVFTGLTSGNYQYIIKDANGCLSLIDGLINRVAIGNNCYYMSYTLPGFSSTYNCNPYHQSINVDPPTGPTAPYMFSSDGVNWQTSNIFLNVTNYIAPFWIKDNTGQIFITTFSFADLCDPPFKVSTQQTPAHCGANGSISVTAADGIPPYQYSLDGINFQASSVFINLAPGTYTVTVKDFYNFTSAKYAIVTNDCVKVTGTSVNSTCGNANGSVTAQATGGTAPYTFSVGGINYSGNNVITGILPGTYFLYAKDASGNKDSVAITVNNIIGPTITKADTVHTGCDNKSGKIIVNAAGGTLPLQFSLTGTNWQNSNIFTGLSFGSYTAYVKDANSCITSMSALITMPEPPPSVNLGNDKTLCEGNTLILDATNTNATYLWQDNTTSSTYTVAQPGLYSVSVKRFGCEAKDTIAVNYNLKPVFTLGPNQGICTGTTLQLNPKINNVSYLWQDGTTTPTYTVTQPGLYYLTATNPCGSKSDSILVTKGICKLYIPNAFTPNGDGKNDFFKASFGENITEYSLQIFNRYGEMVFESKDKSKGWNGTYKGSRQPSDSFIWLIKYKTAIDNISNQLTGSVLLLR